jgi:acetyl esterase/lipase
MSPLPTRLLLTALTALGLFSSSATAADAVAQAIDPSATYLIYLHGQIVEDRGPRPIHPRFGLYDFPAVVAALGARGAVVIAEQRSPGTVMRHATARVRDQVQSLLDAGVAPERVAVVGFSKGGGIAMLAATDLPGPIRLALLASCWSGMQGELKVTAQVLSIYERSDELAGSCGSLFASEPPPASFAELAIDTGRGHGAFYLPHPAWIEPLLDWIHGSPAAAASRQAQR